MWAVSSDKDKPMLLRKLSEWEGKGKVEGLILEIEPRWKKSENQWKKEHDHNIKKIIKHNWKLRTKTPKEQVASASIHNSKYKVDY
jgi:hypothetical protein